MIITMKKDASAKELERLREGFDEKGLRVNVIEGEEYNVWGIVGDTAHINDRDILANRCVANVQRVSAPYKLANRMFHPEDTVVDVGGVKVGGTSPIVVIGGPCSVENRDMICRIGEEVRECGAQMIRGGAYKPRTSPYAFQGLGYEGILDMAEARNRTGLPIVSELMSADKIDEFVENVDLIQIGARNMQNFDLLKAVGHVNKPILLKRGLQAPCRSF